MDISTPILAWFFFAKMTVKEIRRLLGKEEEHATDEELQRDIDAANMFKNLFFDDITNNYDQDEND